MSDNLNQQFNDFRLSQMDQFKGMNQFAAPNQGGNEDFMNPNSENQENFLNTMDYYNNISGQDKNQKNFSEIDQMSGNQHEEMMKLMERLNLGQNNEGLFNPIPNNNMGMNQMMGGPMDQMKHLGGDEDDESTFSLNNALNQLSQNQNNQFGNMNLTDNLGNIMNQNNENQNKQKTNKNQNKKNNSQQQNQDNQMNLFNQMNPYMNFNNHPLMNMNLGNNMNNQQINDNLLNPMLLNNLNQGLLNNYYSLISLRFLITPLYHYFLFQFSYLLNLLTNHYIL